MEIKSYIDLTNYIKLNIFPKISQNDQEKLIYLVDYINPDTWTYSLYTSFFLQNTILEGEEILYYIFGELNIDKKIFTTINITTLTNYINLLREK